MMAQAPSRRTEAVSARRDFRALRVCWARPSCTRPTTALNRNRPAITAASTYLPSASSSTTAASSIHGTGAQNFSTARRKGCRAVSGMALGPYRRSRSLASVLVRPMFTGDAGAATSATVTVIFGGYPSRPRAGRLGNHSVRPRAPAPVTLGRLHNVGQMYPTGRGLSRDYVKARGTTAAPLSQAPQLFPMQPYITQSFGLWVSPSISYCSCKVV